MKKIDRLLISSFIGPFMIAFMIAIFVLMMQTLWLYIEDIAGKGLGLFMLIELLAYKCVGLFPLAIPIAILIASVMVMGNLAENYELSSIKSAGVPLLRTMRSLVVFGFFAALFSYYSNNHLMPVANLKFGSRMYDIQRQKPALRLDAGVFNYDFQGYVIHIGKKGGNGRSIEDVLIYDHSETSAEDFKEIIAAKGEMYTAADGKYFIMNLENGHQYIQTTPSRSSSGSPFAFVRTSFGQWTKVFDLGEFELSRTDEELFKSNRSMLTISQLGEASDSIAMRILEREKAFSNHVSNYFYYMELDSTFIDPPAPDTTSIAFQQQQQAGVSGDSVAAAPVAEEDDGYDEEPVRPAKANNPKVRRKYPRPFRPADGTTTSNPQFPAEKIDSFDQVLASFPVYEQKRFLNKAKTYARSIENQAEAAERFLLDLRESRVKHIYDMHMKYSMAVVCIIFVFIGAPMGAIVRKGGFGYPILISIIFFMVFVILTIFCRKIAETFILPPVASAWIPNAVLLPIGIILTIQAMNDSKIVNIDRISAFFVRLFRRRNKVEVQTTRS